MPSPGIIVRGNLGLHEILQPIAVEISAAYWVINVQAGPFDSLWLYESQASEDRVERQWIEIPELAGTSGSCWQPHTFPAIADHVIIDEWSSFAACCCSENEVRKNASNIWNLLTPEGKDEFDKLLELSDIFLCHVDGWWECYSPRKELLQKINDRFPQSFERSWRLAFESPSQD